MSILEELHYHGVAEFTVPPGLHKDEKLIKSALDWFGWILHDQDPRWWIINAFLEAKETAKFLGEHQEVAFRATYLSEYQSFRNEYGRFGKEQNIVQLCRAINNLAFHPYIQSAFNEVFQSNFFPDHIHLELYRTKKFTLGTDARNITGCPEALYQLQAFYGEKYIGRIGINFHIESDTLVISIANVQGASECKDIYNELRNKYRITFFNKMIKVAKDLSLHLEKMGFKCEIRGVQNPKKGKPELYQGVFAAEGIPVFERHVSKTEAEAE